MAKEQEQKKGKKKMSEAEKAARKEALKNEPKNKRFQRVVTPRVRKAVKAVMQVSFCAGSSYAYTKEEADKIVKTLIEAVFYVESAFAKTATAKDQFTL